MAEFYPNTVIKILKDVPLDASYTDVLDFASETAQNQYFSSKSKYVFNNVSYQRVNYSVDSARPPLTCTVPMNADNLYDCNYIMFQNANYGTKWFYAYIVNVGFVSANVSKISYVLDDYQTWLFDFTVGESYVLREHTNDDTIGSNLEPEPFEISNYIISGYNNDSSEFMNCKIMMAVAELADGSRAEGQWIDNKTYTGLGFMYFDIGHDSGIKGAIDLYVEQGKGNSIIYIQIVPARRGITTTLSNCRVPSGFGDYVPANNKLFTYPYCKLSHINSEGQGNEYKYEFFSSLTNIQFTTHFTDAPIPSAITMPKNYLSSNDYQYNIVSYVTSINKYPVCSWTNDSFYEWFALNQNQLQTQKHYQQLAATYKIASGAVSTIATTIAATAATVATGGIAAAALLPSMSAGLSSFSQGLDEYRKAGDMYNAQIADMKVKPDTLSGGSTNPYSMYMSSLMGNHFYRMQIPQEQAERIDSFFTMYGYTTNKVKVPNLTGRSNFNYVKLQQPYITGSIPVESMINIKKIFSNGVRIWHNTATFMNYNVKNNIKESSNDNNETT